jgi:acyl-[acyl-carrier-protein]-phospholipid O-acyltransferase/long-chain-fatty-acid--[acyl-carrier-protein] ligase
MSVQEQTAANVEEQVFAIVAEQTGADRAALRRDLPLTDLGADSLDLVGVVIEVEEAFGVEVSDDQWAALGTLGDLIDFVEKNRSTASEKPSPEPPSRTGLTAAVLRLILRLGIWLLSRTVYRVKVIGRENVPEQGGALLVPNHVTFVDTLFLLASVRRPVRFLVEASYFNKRLFRPFMKALGAIPISASGAPRDILRSLRGAGEYLDRGELVCLFPEGQLTRTGMMVPFRRGMERILKGRDVPVVPVYMDRLWGSIFSRAGGRFFFKMPERIPYPVTVCFGAPLPPTTPVPQVRLTVHNLSETAWTARKPDRRPLHRTFLRAARRRPFRFALADAARPHVSRLKVLAGAVALARALRPRWQGQEFVGILLPPSVPGALVNLAAALAGKAAVNLNYTAGRAGMTSAVRQANLRSVVTSQTFVEKARLELPEGVEPIWAEDLAASIGFGSRWWATLLALFAPARLLERACGMRKPPAVDDIVTVIFSSGSTGEPKGVLLSHFNIDSNVEAAAQVFRIEKHDRLLGILPLFHSFGYLSLWVAVNHGIGIIFHPNPLDAGAVGELVERYEATILLATPTFLQLYQRRCAPAQFGSLRIVMAGAEKLPERQAKAFEDHFGIRPLEGYGMTECSPVVAASTLDYRAAGLYQPGSRRGSVGQPLPGVTVKTVDPDTFEPLPPLKPGLLLVRGPNVMRGYLGRPDLTAKAMRDGWYVTGDMAVLDEDGFLYITDRLARFSKIGGEMVPHGRVEEALHEAAGAAGPVFAVTAVPDERKGERLAVLHTLEEGAIPAVLDRLAANGLPNLFLPRRENFVKVEQLPLLGSGKLDLREVKRVAADRLTSSAQKAGPRRGSASV